MMSHASTRVKHLLDPPGSIRLPEFSSFRSASHLTAGRERAFAKATIVAEDGPRGSFGFHLRST